MPRNLADLIRTEAGSLADELACELRQAGAPHYRNVGERLLLLRCQRLVEAFVESCGGDPVPFESHVRDITAQRISEGYYLPEMQLALSLLEQRAWQLTVAGSSIANLVPNLAVVTGTIGRAKDELARAFCAGKERAESEVVRLKVNALFAGTEGHVEPRETAAESRRAG